MARLSRMLLLLQCLAAIMMATSVQGGKPAYEIKMENVECSDTEYVTIHQCRVASFNSTFRISNGTARILKDIPQDSKVELEAFEMMPSGRYSMVPVKFPSGEMCKMLAEEKYFWPDLTDSGNLPKACPIKAGEYYVNNYSVRNDRLPDKLPGERWRFDLVLKTKQTLVVKLSAHIFIDRK